MGRRSGYDYSYNFLCDDEIIDLYPYTRGCLLRGRGFMFEIRTSFKLKTRVRDEIIMGSERFTGYARKGKDLREELPHHINVVSFRMQDDYWMSGDEFDALVDAAMDFAKQRAAENPQQQVIPVAVRLDVWTVQQEGESVNDTVDRAIKPEQLIPIHVLCPSETSKKVRPQYDIFHVDVDDDEDLPPYLERQDYLRELARIRVEDEAGLDLMKDNCPVCWRSPIIGDQVSNLPFCNHACHPHCFFKWLEQGRRKCPSCSLYIPVYGSIRLR